MKYFTPQLYARFNSKDRRVVSTAHEEWETAIEQYQSHLGKIRRRLVPNAQKLAKSLCLHDAQYLGLRHPRIPHLHHSIAVLASQKDATVFLLVYTLAKDPHIHAAQPNWPFSKKQVHWLYDEFDIDAHGNQQHAVLLSNGKIITLQFRDVQLMTDKDAADLDVA
ncbi:MAG TPA: hypothetical protein VGH74_10150 [Planctomycetaceae bacterium]